MSPAFRGRLCDSFTYDADGNEVTETTHHGQAVTNPRDGAPDVTSAGITTKWYDGADRLVEVRQPQDKQDYYGFAWLTRYIYDLSQGKNVFISGVGSAAPAYGNLYKTQECLSGTQVTVPEGVSDAAPLPASGGPTTCTFQDVRGNTFDALDRSLSKYELGVGTLPEVTNTYDTNGNYGLLTQRATGTTQTDTYTYDASGDVASETFNDNTPSRQYVYDPDGRTASISSSSLGTESKTYDADGRLETATSPTDVLGGATTTYAYYADGLRKSLSLNVPSTGFSQDNLFTYNYRADGARSSLQVTDGATSGAFAWTYTNAGRELTQTDPDTGDSVKGVNNTSPAVTYGAKTYSYDQYGRVASLQLPVAADDYYSLTYDAEGQLYSYIPKGGTYLDAISYDYTSRGELAAASNANGYTANGATCAQLPLQGTGSSGSCSFDARSDAVLSTSFTQSSAGGQPQTTYTLHASQTYHYDSAGREVADDETGCLDTGTGCTPETVTSQRTYDGDSHITSQTIPPGFEPGNKSLYSQGLYTNTSTVTQQYTWGPDGHLTAIQGLFADSTGNDYQSSAQYLWDGDDILLELQNFYGSPAAYINIEKLGFISPSGQINVYDRDWTGTQASSHSSSGFAAWNADPDHWTPADKICEKRGVPCTGGSFGYIPTVTLISASRSDGYTDGLNVFQGVRAYDPNSAQWTSPDAYSGDVHDPMSQKPYMWNDNNPIEYSDPSGYNPLLLVLGAALCVGGGCEAAAVVALGVTAVAATAYVSYKIAEHIKNSRENGEESPGTPGNPVGSAGGEGAGKRFSDKVKQEAAKAARGVCVYCGVKTVPKGKGPDAQETDHGIAKSRGGNNTPGNANNACKRCNRDKRTTPYTDYKPL